MSYNINWIAVKGDKDAALAALGLEEAGEASQPMFATYCCGKLPGDWLVITSTERRFSVDPALASLAARGLSVGCEMSETVMVSRAVGFIDGHKAWSAEHDPDEGADLVQVDGEPPAVLSDIMRALQQEQEADETGSVDYMFDAPIELMAKICGYRPDKESAVEWSALRKVAAPPGARQEPIPSVRAFLGPLMASLGWAATTTRPDLFVSAGSDEFFRIVDDLHHLMWFDFGWQASTAGDLPFLSVGFLVQEPGAAARGASEPLLAGHAHRSEPRTPLWKRLLSPRAPRPSPAQEISRLLEGAGEDIRAVDAFLRTGTRAPNVRVGRGSAKDTWPSLPSRRDNGRQG